MKLHTLITVNHIVLKLYFQLAGNKIIQIICTSF